MRLKKERTFSDSKMNISVIIPVYNSEQTLAALVKRLQPVLEVEAAEYELILTHIQGRIKCIESGQQLRPLQHIYLKAY